VNAEFSLRGGGRLDARAFKRYTYQNTMTMSKLNAKTALSWIFYSLGDLISRPMMRYDWAWAYPAYSRLMRWSSDLDRENAVWGPPVSEVERDH
jgi:hypothetical protein